MCLADSEGFYENFYIVARLFGFGWLEIRKEQKREELTGLREE